MTDRELLQQALEALEKDQYDMVPDKEGHMEFRKEAAITALRERLAQPFEHNPWKNVALRLGEELSSVGPDGYYDMHPGSWLEWAMAQEPRGKNSLAQPEHEPVCAHGVGKTKCDFCKQPAQPSKPWVGLTEEEIADIYIKWDATPGVSMADFARAIEAKLKEKNHG